MMGKCYIQNLYGIGIQMICGKDKLYIYSYSFYITYNTAQYSIL